MEGRKEGRNKIKNEKWFAKKKTTIKIKEKQKDNVFIVLDLILYKYTEN